jgi:hypothetical protein
MGDTHWFVLSRVVDGVVDVVVALDVVSRRTSS